MRNNNDPLALLKFTIAMLFSIVIVVTVMVFAASIVWWFKIPVFTSFVMPNPTPGNNEQGTARFISDLMFVISGILINIVTNYIQKEILDKWHPKVVKIVAVLSVLIVFIIAYLTNFFIHR